MCAISAEKDLDDAATTKSVEKRIRALAFPMLTHATPRSAGLKRAVVERIQAAGAVRVESRLLLVS